MGVNLPMLTRQVAKLDNRKVIMPDITIKFTADQVLGVANILRNRCGCPDCKALADEMLVQYHDQHENKPEFKCRGCGNICTQCGGPGK